MCTSKTLYSLLGAVFNLQQSMEQTHKKDNLMDMDIMDQIFLHVLSKREADMDLSDHFSISWLPWSNENTHLFSIELILGSNPI